MRLAPLLAALGLALAPPARDVERLPVLPEGAAARALAGVGPETAPAELARDLDELHALLAREDPWAEPRVWELWSASVVAEARRPPGEEDPAQRAGLALLARAQGRGGDAWAHLAALGGHPGHLAAVLPHLFPGVPLDAPPAPGARPAPLPDGVRLTPLVPPDALEVMYGPRHRSEMLLRALEIGAARVDVRLVLEPSGVELELTHAGGGAASFEVVLPSPEEFELRVEFVDWIQAEDPGTPRRVRVAADDEHARQIFGRFERRTGRLPALPEELLPATLELAGLWLSPAEGEERAELLAAAARALTAVAGIEGGVLAPGEPSPPGDFGGIVVRLPAGDALPRLLAHLAGAAERWRLGAEGSAGR